MPRGRAARLAAGCVVVLVAGCGGGGTVSPSPQSATPSLGPSDAPVAFTLDVVPAALAGRTIGGQPTVFLVTISGSSADGPVALSAAAAGAAISIAPPERLPPGVVGEVTVVPGVVSQDVDLEVTIRATRAGIEERVQRTLALAPGEDTLRPEAERHLALFLIWLAASHPELGIGPRTPWVGSPGSLVLGAAQYQFVSDEWELGLAWLVMIAPDDRATVYLRRRWTEARPSRAFEIASVAAGTAPREIAPPDAVWR